MASISTRLSIRWLPDEPSEPTSTLVLTSPEHRFIDLRYKPTPSAPELHWGFAGTSSRSGATGVWTHTIDSRSDAPAAVVDTGTFSPHPDHADDPAIVLERGKMRNFDDGDDAVEKEYEEVWRDEEIVPRGVVVLELKGRSPLSRLAGEPHDAVGLVVKLGAWTQGILKYKGEVTTERWRRPRIPTADAGEGEGEGKEEGKEEVNGEVSTPPVAGAGVGMGEIRLFKTGSGNLPCAALSALLADPETTGLGVGYTLDDGQWLWEVVEESSW